MTVETKSRHVKRQDSGLMKDTEFQIDPLLIESKWIPTTFKKFLQLWDFRPWPYQIRIFEALFEAWTARATINPDDPEAFIPDVLVQQCRQSGKTVPTALWLGYMIVIERCQCVILSTKLPKTRKLARYIIRVMRWADEDMPADGIGEARFSDEAGFVCFSGKPDAERESDTAHIVVVDEAQDIDHAAIMADISPMRSGTTGILVALGIGGTVDSFAEKLRDDPRAIKVNIPYQQVIKERPHYRLTVEADRRKMLPWEFSAHYEVKRIEEGVTNLIPEIINWNDAFPGMEFDQRFMDKYVKQDGLEVGMDWGERIDMSCGIALATFMPPGWRGPFDHDKALYVIYGGVMFGGKGYRSQLTGIVNWLEEVPWDRVRPEANSIGVVLEEFLYEEMEAAFPDLPDSSCYPLWTDADKTTQALKRIALASFGKRLYYVEPADPILQQRWNPQGALERILADLRGVKVSVIRGGRMQTSHSDPMAALRILFYDLRPGAIYERPKRIA